MDFHDFHDFLLLGMCFWWSLGRSDHNLPEGANKWIKWIGCTYLQLTPSKANLQNCSSCFFSGHFMSLAAWQSIFPGSRRQELSWHIKAQVISRRIFGNRATKYIQSMTMPLTVSAKEYGLMTITFERHQEIGTIRMPWPQLNKSFW